jgi:hypothetical protein
VTRRATAAALLLVAVLAACSGSAQPSSPQPASVAASATQKTPTYPTAEPTASEPADLPRPGRPFTADDLLAEMRDSRRPGGVPDRLQTREIASALAAEIWTVDGEPWDTVSIGGSCGPIRCTLDVGGAAEGAVGEDLWTFEVIPDAPDVAVLSAELHSIPPAIVETLDAVARRATPEVAAEDMVLAGAAWLPPPDYSLYDLAYRTGNEEGSCELDLRVDLAAETVEEVRRSAC